MDIHSEFVTTAALRFDGYRYQHWTGETFLDLDELVEGSLGVYEDEFKNFAALFLLQRFLGKLGGEMTLPTSRVHRAFWILFFHLLERRTPSAYAFPEYQQKWETIYFPRRAAYVKPIRRMWERFIRVDAEITKAGAALTKSGALLAPEGQNWPTEGRWCFAPNIFDWNPTIYPARGRDSEDGRSEWRKLTQEERQKIKSDPDRLVIRRYFAFYSTLLRDVRANHRSVQIENRMNEKAQVQRRFTLEPRHWYTVEFIGDEFGPELRSYSPIRVTAIHPSKNGTRSFHLEFYHANYPDGVRDKTYQLRTLERAKHFLLAESLNHNPRRFLLFREISWEWLRLHFGVQQPNQSQDLTTWLEARA